MSSSILPFVESIKRNQGNKSGLQSLNVSARMDHQFLPWLFSKVKTWWPVGCLEHLQRVGTFRVIQKDGQVMNTEKNGYNCLTLRQKKRPINGNDFSSATDTTAIFLQNLFAIALTTTFLSSFLYHIPRTSRSHWMLESSAPWNAQCRLNLILSSEPVFHASKKSNGWKPTSKLDTLR